MGRGEVCGRGAWGMGHGGGGRGGCGACLLAVGRVGAAPLERLLREAEVVRLGGRAAVREAHEQREAREGSLGLEERPDDAHEQRRVGHRLAALRRAEAPLQLEQRAVAPRRLEHAQRVRARRLEQQQLAAVGEAELHEEVGAARLVARAPARLGRVAQQLEPGRHVRHLVPRRAAQRGGVGLARPAERARLGGRVEEVARELEADLDDRELELQPVLARVPGHLVQRTRREAEGRRVGARRRRAHDLLLARAVRAVRHDAPLAAAARVLHGRLGRAPVHLVRRRRRGQHRVERAREEDLRAALHPHAPLARLAAHDLGLPRRRLRRAPHRHRHLLSRHGALGGDHDAKCYRLFGLSATHRLVS